MKQTDPHFKLRLPPELKERIERAAAESQRSMSAEIVARLAASFDDLTDRVLVLETLASENERRMQDIQEKLDNLVHNLSRGGRS